MGANARNALVPACCHSDRAGQGRAWQGRAGQGMAGQGRAGQGTVWLHDMEGAATLGM